jgi:peptide/nickel transport system substrate-binding protein
MRSVSRSVLVGLVLALVAVGCGGDDEDDAGGQTPTTQSAEPVRGGTLVVAIDSDDPGSLNPAVSSGYAFHVVSELMFNGLVGADNDGRLVGELAERWTVEENGAIYRFALRDARWHDGRPVTSEDVKFTFEQALIRFHSRTRGALTGQNLTIETPDPKTVVFRFGRPYAPLLSQLNVTEAPILPKHVYESCGADIDKVASCPPNKAPVGSGPFKFASYDANEVRLTRNPDYFRPGLPYLDTVVQRFIRDAGTRTAALQRKEVDWLWTTQGPDVAALRGDRSITLAEAARGPGGGNCILQVVYNMQPPDSRMRIFTDLRMRQALAYATNRQQAADQALFGQGRVAPQPINTAIPVARAQGLQLPGFDLNRARQLLDQVGWRDEGGGTRVARGVQNVPDGTPLRIDFVHFSGQQADYAAVLKQQWKVVGVELETKQMDNPTLVANMFRDRTFDTGIVSYCNESDPQIGVRRQYHSSQISTAGFTNGAGYRDPEMDALWDQSVSEVDEGRRRAIFQRIQEQAVRDLPYWWLAETVNVRAYNSVCTGFNIQNTGLFAEGAYCRR